MKGSRALVTILLIALAVGAGFLVYHLEFSSQPAVCQICGRGISKQVEFRIETAHGSIHACCPSCAMHYMINNPGKARKELATDFNSGRLIPARSAYYDEGGDVQYCTRRDPTIQRVPGEGIETRVYDRCLPVLVAFANKDDAEAYRQEHGGRVVTFEQALQDARSH